jgi:DNA polymerase
MSQPSKMSVEQLVQQARQHVDSLRRAGVEWLPTAPLPETPPLIPAAEVGMTMRSSSLFPEEERVSAPTPAEALTPDQRRQALKVLTDTVSACTRCPGLAATRTQTVFGVGPANPDLCFIGEAPGADEDAQGEPFVGAAGQLLTRIITACGLKREEVYICNIIKCRPPGNRTPQADEAANCREFLDKQLELVNPKFICALGGTAAKNLLQTDKSIGQLRRQFHSYRGIPVICTYHPAFLLPHRSPDKKRDVWEDMKMLLSRMGRPIPK